MGLAICHSIVESHGGRISASPASNRGSIFQFELPINAA
jgi:signal transduction histidine kinase